MEPSSTDSRTLVAYVRVSTDEQAASGLGLEAQESLLRRAFDFREWELAEVIRDEGVSGSTLERPGLQRALRLIADRTVDGLVVAKLDRLTRSSRDFGELIEWFQYAEARLVMLEPDVDTSTAGGRVVAQVMAAFAEFERQQIADRTRAALAAKRARGEVVGLPAVADRPELAARIRMMRAAGLSYGAIAAELNDEGIPTARGAEQWRPSSVQNVAGPRRRPPRRRHPALPEVARRRAA